MATQDIAMQKPKPEPPLVSFLEHPLLGTRNVFWIILAMLIATYVGTQIIAGLYFLAFEVDPGMTAWWHNRVPSSTWRHNIRDVGEGLFGGMLAQCVAWNSFKARKSLSHFERQIGIADVNDDKPFSGRQLAASLMLVIPYAAPGFLVFFGITELVSHLTGNLRGVTTALQSVYQPLPGASLWSKLTANLMADWPQKLMGIGSALFFGRRPMRGVFNDLQLWFVERLIVKDRPLRFYHTPPFRARYNYVQRQGLSEGALRHKRRWLTWLMRASMVVATAFAGVGFYVLTFVAG